MRETIFQLETGPLNAAEWIFSDIDLARVDKVRKDGSVLNHAH